MKNERIESLDSLRGISALIVVIFHCLLAFEIFRIANHENKFINGYMEAFTVTPLHTIWAGKEAVLLFFILSGFVLAIPFTKNTVPTYGVFIIKRFFRIYIPYIIVMAISVILANLFWEHNTLSDSRWTHPVSLQSIIAYLIMHNSDTPNVNGVVWTIFIEMKVSLIFPFIMLLIMKFKPFNVLLLFMPIILFADFLNGRIYESTNIELVRQSIGFIKDSIYYSMFFIFGAILSKYRHNFGYLTSIDFKYKIILLFVSLVLINNKWLVTVFKIENITISDLVSAVGILLLFVLVLNSIEIQKALTHKFLLFLGKISFSLYLVHIPVLGVTTFFLTQIMPKGIAFVFVPILSIPVAYVTYKWVEEPAMRLGKKFSGRYKDLNTEKRKAINSQ